jgi:hypothetical protein
MLHFPIVITVNLLLRRNLRFFSPEKVFQSGSFPSVRTRIPNRVGLVPKKTYVCITSTNDDF